MSNNKYTVVINGSGGVGKDSFVKLVTEVLDGKVINYSSVSPIKLLASGVGWNGEKTEKDRKFLSDLKLLCTRYNDFPFNNMRKVVKDFLDDSSKDCAKILFLHIREPKEIKRAVKEFNAKTVIITNLRVADIKSNEADENVYDYKYDYYIDNSGSFDDLMEAAKIFISELDNNKPQLNMLEI